MELSSYDFNVKGYNDINGRTLEIPDPFCKAAF